MTRTISKSWPDDLGIRSPFTIPSGIVTTVPSVIAAIAREIPEIGFLTTKTLSVEPREGYREPVIHEYYPGCFVNAVGLANPGARAFVDAMRPLRPLHEGKPLLVSIMGRDAQEFGECARILDPIADAFELNLSCPHVKGAGQTVGSDPDAVRAIILTLKDMVGKPVIAKLSPNLADIPGMVEVCRDAGADGISLINTLGPGMAVDADGNPVLTHINGGLSGAGILPVGLKAVREAAAVTDLPIIASGGISCSDDVRAYARAGATLFAVGSALAGMTTEQIKVFFRDLVRSQGSHSGREGSCRTALTPPRTDYLKTSLVEKTDLGTGFFQIRLETGRSCEPGQFFFLRLPGVGEKPFSPARDVDEPIYLVRSVGPFTRALEALESGDPVYMRGPYGNGFAVPDAGRPLVLVGGGTGAAPLMMAARKWTKSVAGAFFGFSFEVPEVLRGEIAACAPNSKIVCDPPGRVGEVLEALREDIRNRPDLYENCAVFVCGPAAMMAAAVNILEDCVPRDRIFMAGEDVMKCGIGLCGSCGTPSGLRSCVDGPVMTPQRAGE